jgi:hypothetical protein
MISRLTRGALGAALCAAVLAAGGAASAQDASLDPAFGSANLRAGFTPDPYNVNSILAGGANDASDLGGACVGMIADAPDFRLNYTAGGLPLNVWVYSNADTTLVINGPDGRWACNDDGAGGNGVNPGLRWAQPQSGVYDIWIGKFGGGDAVPARLVFTETH